MKTADLFSPDSLAFRAWSTTWVWLALTVSMTSAGALIVVLTVALWNDVAGRRRAGNPVATPSAERSQAISGAGGTDSSELARSLPTDDADAVIRYAIRAAKDHQVVVAQVRSEPVRTEPRRLGQIKFSLQLRGDYIGIKSVLVDVLGKFPGMTLQHLSIRHGTALAGKGSIDGGDEAGVELLQFLRPATIE